MAITAQEKPEESNDEDSGFRTVVKDLGLTPGNDRALVLECGHTALVSIPHFCNGGPIGCWEGDVAYCSECMDVD